MSPPLVRLQLESGGIRITPRFRFLGIILPNWYYPWNDVIRAERVQVALAGDVGVRFHIRDRQYPFTFVYSAPILLLEALARHRVAVDFDRHRIGWMET